LNCRQKLDQGISLMLNTLCTDSNSLPLQRNCAVVVTFTSHQRNWEN